MSLWTDVPYELQSPTWRNATNRAQSGQTSWNPTLNTNAATDFLSAYQNSRRETQVNTVSANGQTGFINALKDVGVGLLSSLGARDRADRSMVQPVNFGQERRGLDTSTLVLIGAIGAGVYFLTKS